MALIQFLAITALGLFVSWLFHLWIGLFDNLYVAAAIWGAACICYAIIYDRRQARLRRASEATKSAPQWIEH